MDQPHLKAVAEEELFCNAVIILSYVFACKHLQFYFWLSAAAELSASSADPYWEGKGGVYRICVLYSSCDPAHFCACAHVRTTNSAYLSLHPLHRGVSKRMHSLILVQYANTVMGVRETQIDS